MLKKKVAVAITAALGMTAMSSANAAIGPFDFTAWGGFLQSAASIPYTYDDDSMSVAEDPAGNEAQVLVFPYYTVHDGKQTSFNIRNTKDEYKAIRVRFRESKNSYDVLDFNVYLSPFDMYTMQVNSNGAGGVTLSSSDNSCTFPTIPAGGKDFKHNLVGNDDLTEGYLIVTEMGTFDRSMPLVPTASGEDLTLAGGITHGPDGMPKDCLVIDKLWGGQNGVGGGTMSNGFPQFNQGGALAQGVNYVRNAENNAAPGTFVVDTNNPDPYYYGVATPNWTLPPTGGLVGTAVIIDIAKGTALVVDPTPISGYSSWPQHYSPNDPAYGQLPSLSSGNIRVSTAPVMNSDGHSDVVHPYWAFVNRDYGSAKHHGKFHGINPFPITDVLSAITIDNEYVVGLGLQESTDWMLTFPMRYHGLFSIAELQVVQLTPISVGLGWVDAHDDDVYAPYQVWDREEQPDLDNFSPVMPIPLSLPREVNVVEFQNRAGTYDPDSSSVFGSHFPVPISLSTGWDAGWAKMYFDHYSYSVGSIAAPTRYSWWVDYTARATIADFQNLPVDPVMPYVGDAGRLPTFYQVGYNGIPVIGAAGITADIGGGLWVGEVEMHNKVVNHMDED